MKKFKYLILVLVGAFLLPMSVNAAVKADSELSADSKEVKVYVFRGEGCPHCEEALEWFKSIEDEHGDKFEVIGYETWKNADNNSLMEDISTARGDNAEGVPYILIGDEAWNGFDESYKEPMLKTIDSEYSKEVNKRTDIVKEVLAGTYKTSNITKTKSTDIVSAVILLVLIVIAGIAAGIYYYMKNNKTKKEVVVKKVAEEPVKKTTKKTTTKKTTTTKKKTTKK